MLYDDCLIRGDLDEVAAFLEVSRRTLERYKRDPDNMPGIVKKLLRLRLEGDLRAIGGDAWEGYYLDDGLLYIPGWRNGWTPGKLRGMFFTFQQVAALKSQVRDLQAKLWAIEKVRTAERTGSLRAKMQQHAEALRALSAAVAADLDENALIDEFRRESFPK